MSSARRLAPGLLIALAGLLAAPIGIRAQAPEPEITEPSAPPGRDDLVDPLFLGYQSEPGMDFGGRSLAAVQSLLSRSVGSIGALARHPGVAPAWEFPLAAAMLLVQHEVGGHGGRGREFGLGPRYSFGYDFSASTSIDRAPETNEQTLLLTAGGVEADQVLARRVLLDALRPEGVDAAKIPLAFMTKLDLTSYVYQTLDPAEDGADFVEQYRNGNDMAFYLIARQSQRRGGDAAAVWEGTFDVDLTDPLLADMWRDLRATAVWNALDPALVAAVFAYFRDHVLGGGARARPPALRVGGLSFSLGTRGALGPQAVSRFLDLHAAGDWGVATVYARDLDSSIDRTYGVGAALHAVRIGERLELGLAADVWDEPDSREGLYDGGGWNASVEVDARLGERWAVAALLGSKSAGFFPGLPIDSGVYLGLGVVAGGGRSR